MGRSLPAPSQHSSREGRGHEPASSSGSPGTPRMQAVFSITPGSFCRGLSSLGAPMSKQPKFTGAGTRWAPRHLLPQAHLPSLPTGATGHA